MHFSDVQEADKSTKRIKGSGGMNITNRDGEW